MFHLHNIGHGLIALLAFLSFSSSALAQSKYLGELGVLGGVSYYNGDANPTTPFQDNNPYYGAFVRINLHPHWVFKLDVSRGTVEGNTQNYNDNYFPTDAQTSFKNDFWNIGAQFELNFFKYGLASWDKEVYRHTPYVTVGPALGIFQGWDGNQLAGNLAFGIGYKFKIGGRWNLGVEWTMHKLFRDDLDQSEYEEDALNNPYGQKTSSTKNNDWYSSAFVYLSFDLIRHKGVCRSMN